MNKKSLLYIGVFLAGAVITPLYLSLFNDKDGDRPSEVAEDESAFDESNDEIFLEENTNQVFVPRDSQEAIENDYAVSPELRIPTSLPQYAANQPSIPSYPNYAAMSPPPLTFPERSRLTEENPKTTDDRAIASRTPQSVPIIGSTPRSLADDIFIPPSTRPDSEAIAPEAFNPNNLAPTNVKFNFGNQITTDGLELEEEN